MRILKKWNKKEKHSEHDASIKLYKGNTCWQNWKKMNLFKLKHFLGEITRLKKWNQKWNTAKLGKERKKWKRRKKWKNEKNENTIKNEKNWKNEKNEKMK